MNINLLIIRIYVHENPMIAILAYNRNQYFAVPGQFFSQWEKKCQHVKITLDTNTFGQHEILRKPITSQSMSTSKQANFGGNIHQTSICKESSTFRYSTCTLQRASFKRPVAVRPAFGRIRLASESCPPTRHTRAWFNPSLH